MDILAIQCIGPFFQGRIERFYDFNAKKIPNDEIGLLEKVNVAVQIIYMIF